MNNIFENNITALMTKNKELAQKLQTHIPSAIPQLISENNAYNILYKDKKLHNPQNPLAEAQNIFAMATNEPVAIHLVYGLGLGYLFQITSLNSKGTVILYEPDLNIMQFSFSLVDFSKDILKNNVFITDNYDVVTDVIYKHSGMKNSPQMLSLPTRREQDEAGFNNLVQKLKNLIGGFSLDLKYTKQNFYPSLKMLIQNIPQVIKEKPLAHFKDAYKGKTAVIISAGPTLDRNIETIQKYRDNIIIFAVGTAVKTLYRNDIKPDFISIIETFDSSKQLNGLDLKDVNFITEPYSNPNLRKFDFKNIFSHISANSPINHLWKDICGENIEEYWSKGTVSYTAINSARLLGCSKIILVGQDLAYIEGQCYSKESAYKDLVCEYNPETNRWEITAKDFEKFAEALSNSPDIEKRHEVARRRLSNLNNSLYYVKGINGDMLPTESVYAAFVLPLSEYTEHFNDREYINTSMVGAQIDGYKNMSLEEALKDSSPRGDINLYIDNATYDVERIKTELKNNCEQLKFANKALEEGEQLYRSLINDMNRYKSVTREVLIGLKKLSLNYLSLSSDFADKSKIFDFMTSSEKIDLDYEMKMTQEFTIPSIANVCEKIHTYNTNALKKIDEITTLIKNVAEKL